MTPMSNIGDYIVLGTCLAIVILYAMGYIA